VTAGYIGPDRRKDSSRGPSDIPLFEVPNTLRAKAEGKQPNRSEMEDLIRQAQDQINAEKLKRNAFQLSFLAALIVTGTPGLNDDATNRDHLENMIVVTDDLIGRIPSAAVGSGTDPRVLVEMCTGLRNLAQRMVSTGNVSDPKALQLLRPSSDAILVGLNPDVPAAEITGQVSSAIRKYRERERERLERERRE
jgi:hypothetical protein